MSDSPPLQIDITSFSYKSVPGTLFSWEEGRHGGGFVFDCRSLPNPGRLTEYKLKTGRDSDVASYLSASDEVNSFKEHVFALVDGAVENFLSRGFSSVSFAFGCTGGQHRSVFFAESLNSHLKERFGQKVVVVVKHPSLVEKGLL